MTIIYENIILDGSSIFINKTKEALDLIKKVNYLSYVQKYIGKISENEKSGMAAYLNPPTFNVGKKTYMAELYWYASCIVHDSHHSYLYQKNLPWTGKEAEEKCLLLQIQFIKDSKGPSNYITYLQSLIKNNVDYYSNYNTRNW